MINHIRITPNERFDVFIDLDGTLIDSSSIFLESTDVIAPGHRERVMQICKAGGSKSEFDALLGPGVLNQISQRTSRITEERDCLFPNILTQLQRLTDLGCHLHLISHSPPCTIATIARQGISTFFETVSLVPILPKEAVIKQICQSQQSDPSQWKNRCVMIGDTVDDMRAGISAGITPIGVSSGLTSSYDLSWAGTSVLSFEQAVDIVERMLAPKLGE